MSRGRRSIERRVVRPSDRTYWRAAESPTTVNYRLRMHTATELKQTALEAGFADVELCGDAAGGPFSRDSRLVLVEGPVSKWVGALERSGG